MQDYAFKMHAPASLSDRSMNWCHGVPELRLRPIDSCLNFLLVLGVQKAGTTWLFDALATHPLFSGAEHGYRCVFEIRIQTLGMGLRACSCSI